jgi:CHAT domain-containing protein
MLPAERAGQSLYSRASDAREESGDLSRLYGERRAVVLAGADASEDRLKAEAGKASVLHLDVRGVLNESAPLFSFATFSSSAESKEDGVLEVRELFGLDLKSDLIVMPECELARPNAGAIRAMTGLSWAWFVAGCPVSVVSSWRSEAASDLTSEYHRTLKSGWRRESKAKSWQAAVRRSIASDDHSHPYFWAGFTVMGDAR